MLEIKHKRWDYVIVGRCESVFKKKQNTARDVVYSIQYIMYS